MVEELTVTDSRDGRTPVGVEAAVAMRRCGMRDGVRSSGRTREREIGREDQPTAKTLHAAFAHKTLTGAVQRQRRTVTRRRLRAGPAHRARVRLGAVARAARRQAGAAGRVRGLARRVPAGRRGGGAAQHADAAALVVAERVGRGGGQRGARRPRHGDRTLRALTDLHANLGRMSEHGDRRAFAHVVYVSCVAVWRIEETPNIYCLV